ncbi:hypothetical protein [Streptomyces coeruleorubidus]|uniref:hypothetical protein n=1 Tax=Streptomyces coeruleorubidus TaxID=116188 RepID=UPI0033A6E754
MTSPPPGRYHLTLTSDDRPVMHGWWGSEPVSRAKFRDWIGEHGTLPDARVDEEAGTTLTTWPDEA